MTKAGLTFRKWRNSLALSLPDSYLSSIAPATALDTFRNSLPLSSLDGRVVRIMVTSCVSGSAQATVPVAPECPKVRDETMSPKYAQTGLVDNPQPRPQGLAIWLF